MSKLVLVLIGRKGSGKTEVAQILKNRGFKIVEQGDLFRRKMQEKQIEYNTKNINKFHTTLGEKGQTEITKEALDIVNSSNGDKFVVSGVRLDGQIRYLRQHCEGFVSIGIVADGDRRLERIIGRSREGDPKEKNEFANYEKEDEVFNIEKKVAQSTYILKNNGTLGELEDAVDEILDMIESKKEVKKQE